MATISWQFVVLVLGGLFLGLAFSVLYLDAKLLKKQHQREVESKVKEILSLRDALMAQQQLIRTYQYLERLATEEAPSEPQGERSQ